MYDSLIAADVLMDEKGKNLENNVKNNNSGVMNNSGSSPLSSKKQYGLSKWTPSSGNLNNCVKKNGVVAKNGGDRPLSINSLSSSSSTSSSSSGSNSMGLAPKASPEEEDIPGAREGDESEDETQEFKGAAKSKGKQRLWFV